MALAKKIVPVKRTLQQTLPNLTNVQTAGGRPVIAEIE